MAEGGRTKRSSMAPRRFGLMKGPSRCCLLYTSNQMHLMNTPWAILLPGACSVWNIIIMRTQFTNIPDGLKEVAMIDGASDFTILSRILIPLSGSVIAVLVLFLSLIHIWRTSFRTARPCFTC